MPEMQRRADRHWHQTIVWCLAMHYLNRSAPRIGYNREELHFALFWWNGQKRGELTKTLTKSLTFQSGRRDLHCQHTQTTEEPLSRGEPVQPRPSWPLPLRPKLSWPVSMHTHTHTHTDRDTRTHVHTDTHFRTLHLEQAGQQQKNSEFQSLTLKKKHLALLVQESFSWVSITIS